MMLGLLLLTAFLGQAAMAAAAEAGPSSNLAATVETLAALQDRSTGTAGCRQAAQYIRNRFEELGLEGVGTYRFSLPTLNDQGSFLTIPDRGKRVAVHPLRANAVTPETIPAPGFTAPLIYVGRGELHDFNGKVIAGAVVLMDFDSGKNWQHAAALGAKALIYVDTGRAGKAAFSEKLELTPLQFPRFWMAVDAAELLFGDFRTAANGLVAPLITLCSAMHWQEAEAEIIYGIIPGRDSRLEEELLLIEAFYDSSGMVAGRSPGADEALSVATLLELARHLRDHPPSRSMMLVATAGHGQSLAGMREMIWCLRARAKDLRESEKALDSVIEGAQAKLAALDGFTAGEIRADSAGLAKEAIDERIKIEADKISRELMRLRLEKAGGEEHQIVPCSFLFDRRLRRRLTREKDLLFKKL